MSLRNFAFFGATVVALTACLPQEQIERNPERADGNAQAISFEVMGCERGSVMATCFEDAQAQCLAQGQELASIVETGAQVRNGEGEMTANCMPPAKES